MFINENVRGLALDVSGLDPDWIAAQPTQPDREGVAIFTARGGRLAEWFRDHILPQLPPDIGSAIPDLTLIGERFSFPVDTYFPRRPQHWHFDLPNPEYRSGFQGLFVVGGDACTDVLSPVETDDPFQLIDSVRENLICIPT